MTPYQRKAVSLVENGYAILPIQSGEKRPTFNGWRQYQATADRIEREWQGKGNIGILTDRTPAIDIDIKDEAMALEMERVVLDLLGDAPVRIGMAPKRLLVFRTSAPFRKVDSGFFTDAEGVQHKVEVLGEGQQFVAFGIHPDTRKPYRWVSLESPGDDLHAEDLSLMTADDARAVVEAFIQRAEARGWVRASAAASGPAGTDEFWFLRPKPEATDEEVEEAVRLFPNPGRDYDLWIKVGAALHDHYAGDERGFSLWDQWSSRSSLYEEVLTRRKWDSFGRYTGQPVTIGFLLAATRAERKKAEVVESGAAVAAKARDARAEVRDAIAAAQDGDTLMDEVLPKIASLDIDTVTEGNLLKELANRHYALTKVRPDSRKLSAAVKLLRAGSREGGAFSASEEFKLELHLARHVLSEQFGGGEHIKFFAKMWWRYRRGVWARADDAFIRKCVQDALEALVDAGDEKMQLAARMIESRGDRVSALVGTVFSVMESLCAEDGGEDPLNLMADRVPMVVNTLNSELWFDDDGTVKVRKHSPRHLLTAQVGCEYDAAAECPTWDAALRKVFKTCRDPEAVIRHFEELCGYILQPSRHQAVWMMLKGPGGNGKSFLLGILSSLMGAQATVSASLAQAANGVSNHFGDSLQGKLMLLDDDFKAGALLPDDWLKKLSEAKQITADPKFGRAYNFTARCVPVILTNSWPSTVDLSEGLRRRAMVFESNYVLTDADKDPRDRARILDHELPGVLNRMLAGFQRFLRRGQRFDVPEECRASMDSWMAASNTTAMFAHEVLEAVTDDGPVVDGARVYDAYRQWVRFNEGQVRELSRPKFYDALRKLGFVTRNYGGRQVFKGVRLRANEAIEDFLG